MTTASKQKCICVCNLLRIGGFTPTLGRFWFYSVPVQLGLEKIPEDNGILSVQAWRSPAFHWRQELRQCGRFYPALWREISVQMARPRLLLKIADVLWPEPTYFVSLTDSSCPSCRCICLQWEVVCPGLCKWHSFCLRETFEWYLISDRISLNV